MKGNKFQFVMQAVEKGDERATSEALSLVARVVRTKRGTLNHGYCVTCGLAM